MLGKLSSKGPRRHASTTTTDSTTWRKPGIGFHKNRSCEDQILRLTQSISDGYQITKRKKTILALLDYSKAFNRVWREDLLIRAYQPAS